MIKKEFVYYETFDGKKFFQTGEEGYDGKAQSKATKHEIEVLKTSVGEHKYYVIEVYSDKKMIGYVPRISKQSGVTKHMKFAKQFKTISDAYREFESENHKIIGID